jgi:signal peptidase I
MPEAWPQIGEEPIDRQRGRKIMNRWVLMGFWGLCGALFVREYVTEGVVVATASMDPTLPVGRRVFVNKIVYKVRPPRRGEIVMFPSPVEEKDLIKRVIAVGGDKVKVDKKKVILNGDLLHEPYVVHTRGDGMLEGDNLDVGRVPPNHVFLLGDNRDWSSDSRDWVDTAGEHVFFVSVDKLKGKLMGAQ